jgi:hypothetical protein
VPAEQLRGAVSGQQAVADQDADERYSDVHNDLLPRRVPAVLVGGAPSTGTLQVC